MNGCVLGITTKVIKATKTKAARIVASVPASIDKGSVTVEWDSAQSTFQNHKRAAMELAIRRGLGSARFVACDVDAGYVFTAFENEFGVFTTALEDNKQLALPI